MGLLTSTQMPAHNLPTTCLLNNITTTCSQSQQPAHNMPAHSHVAPAHAACLPLPKCLLNNITTTCSQSQQPAHNMPAHSYVAPAHTACLPLPKCLLTTFSQHACSTTSQPYVTITTTCSQHAFSQPCCTCAHSLFTSTQMPAHKRLQACFLVKLSTTAS
jgi:hypothetical protein